MKEFLSAFLFFLVLFLCEYSSAQVDIEEIRKDINKSQVMSGILEFGMNARMGNKEELRTEGAGLLALNIKRNLVFAAASGRYELDRGIKDKAYIIHLRDNFQIWRFIYWDVFGQQETDEFRKLYSRSLMGTGVRLDYDWSSWVSTVYGSSYMLEYNIVQNNINPSAFHRWNNFVTFLFKINNTVKIGTTTYYQPSLHNFNNYRWYTNLALKIRLSKSLSAKMVSVYRYESLPPGQNVKSQDFSVRNALEYMF